MDASQVARIRANARFRELERKRTVFSWSLCVLMLAAYLSFIFLVAFAKGLVATPIAGVVTLAFPLGLGIIVLAIVLTGIYVLRANGEFDTLNQQVISETAGGGGVP